MIEETVQSRLFLITRPELLHQPLYTSRLGASPKKPSIQDKTSRPLSALWKSRALCASDLGVASVQQRPDLDWHVELGKVDIASGVISTWTLKACKREAFRLFQMVLVSYLTCCWFSVEALGVRSFELGKVEGLLQPFMKAVQQAACPLPGPQKYVKHWPKPLKAAQKVICMRTFGVQASRQPLGLHRPIPQSFWGSDPQPKAAFSANADSATFATSPASKFSWLLGAKMGVSKN